MSGLRVGVSGWNYDHWRNGGFYPQNLPRTRELEYITRQFNSVEINGSFYSLLSPGTGLDPPRRGNRDVYAYLDNDQHAHAPHNALQLMELLGIELDAAHPA